MSKSEQAAFPMVSVVALAECATHAMFAASVGVYAQSEATLTRSLLPALTLGMLLLAGRVLLLPALA